MSARWTVTDRYGRTWRAAAQGADRWWCDDTTLSGWMALAPLKQYAGPLVLVDGPMSPSLTPTATAPDVTGGRGVMPSHSFQPPQANDFGDNDFAHICATCGRTENHPNHTPTPAAPDVAGGVEEEPGVGSVVRDVHHEQWTRRTDERLGWVNDKECWTTWESIVSDGPPTRVMIRRDDPDFRPLLGDFGIGKTTPPPQPAEREASTGAPEQDEAHRFVHGDPSVNPGLCEVCHEGPDDPAHTPAPQPDEGGTVEAVEAMTGVLARDYCRLCPGDAHEHYEDAQAILAAITAGRVPGVRAVGAGEVVVSRTDVNDAIFAAVDSDVFRSARARLIKAIDA